MNLLHAAQGRNLPPSAYKELGGWFRALRMLYVPNLSADGARRYDRMHTPFPARTCVVSDFCPHVGSKGTFRGGDTMGHSD